MTQTQITSLNFKPSVYQQDILGWIFNTTSGNAVIGAVAGSGKSTTLRLIANALLRHGIEPGQIKIIVFGKQNSIDLIAKFGEHWKESIGTLHSAGYQILSEYADGINKVDGRKYYKIARELGYLGTKKNPGKLIDNEAVTSESEFIKLFKLARLNLLEFTEDNLISLTTHYNLENIIDYKACAEAMKVISDRGIDDYYTQKVIDYKEKQWRELEHGARLSEMLDDKLKAIEAIYDSILGDLSLKTLKDKTKELFSDGGKFIDLCTVHRAKGLESNRVFILNHDELPLTWKKQLDWEKEQEQNLLYVALTRSKSELYLVCSEDKDEEE